MKAAFPGHYSPSELEYRALWESALVVLDTNVLLNLYRLPTAARDEFLNILRLLQKRIWIPYQVALEYQRNRLAVIAAERKVTESALETVRSATAELRVKVEKLQIDKRGLSIDSKLLLESVDQAHSKLAAALQTVHDAQLDISISDPIRDSLDSILEGRVGDAPTSQNELDALIADGEQRFNSAIPPGFADVAKEKNPSHAGFVHQHLVYQRKFGDLILWRQLLGHAKSKKLSAVLLITADKKDDWWWQEQGKTLGPHPELVQEIRRVSGVSNFWMYSAAQFMQLAPNYTTAKVSTESVAELKQVFRRPPTVVEGNVPFSYLRSARQYPFDSAEAARIEEAAIAWIRATMRGELERSRVGFPDVVLRNEEGSHGFEIKLFHDFGRPRLGLMTINSILRGYVETKESRLTTFTMVLVMSEVDTANFSNTSDLSAWKSRLSRELRSHPINSIVLGGMQGGTFVPLVWQFSDEARSRVAD